MQSGGAPIWLSLGFFGWVVQNNVSEVENRSWHTYMVQIPFHRGLGVEARRVVMVRTEVAKQGLSHQFNFLSLLVSTRTVPVLLSGNMLVLPRCDHISQSFYSKPSSKGLCVISNQFIFQLDLNA